MAMLAWPGLRERQAGFPSFHRHQMVGNCLGSNRTRFGPRTACFCHNHNRPGRHHRSQRRWGTGRCHCPRTSSRDSGRRHPLQPPCRRLERTHLHRLNRDGHSVGGEETVPGAVLPAFRDPLRARWGKEGLRPNRRHESSHLSPSGRLPRGAEREGAELPSLPGTLPRASFSSLGKRPLAELRFRREEEAQPEEEALARPGRRVAERG